LIGSVFYKIMQLSVMIVLTFLHIRDDISNYHFSAFILA